MNWKMTAKTILMQVHHKVQTFEEINKHLVLVIQDHFMDYIKKSSSSVISIRHASVILLNFMFTAYKPQRISHTTWNLALALALTRMVLQEDWDYKPVQS